MRSPEEGGHGLAATAEAESSSLAPETSDGMSTAGEEGAVSDSRASRSPSSSSREVALEK